MINFLFPVSWEQKVCLVFLWIEKLQERKQTKREMNEVTKKLLSKLENISSEVYIMFSILNYLFNNNIVKSLVNHAC